MESSAMVKLNTSVIIIIMIVALTLLGAHIVHSRVVERVEQEKTLVQQELARELAMEIQKGKILKAIIACESSNRHVIGTLAKVGIDIGKCQINTYWHKERAESMGLDLYDPEDNMDYCLFLFESEGVKPWKSSQLCWQQELEKENIRF
jgi:hypothetical protein